MKPRVGNITKSQEMIPNLPNSNAHIPPPQAMLTFIYFLKHLFMPVVSVSKYLLRRYLALVSQQCPFSNLPALLSMCACQHSTSWPRVGSLQTRAAPYTCCSLSFTVLTIICHVWDLEPSGAVPLIGLKLNPQPLGSGGEGDGAFIGLAGFIRCHRIG